MEASVVRLSTERRFADEGVRLRKNRFEFELKSVSRGGLPPFRAQAGGRARNLGEAGSAQPEGRALDGGGTPTAPSLFDEARRRHPSVLAAFGCCAMRFAIPDGVPPTSPLAVLAASPLRDTLRDTRRGTAGGGSR